MAAQSDGFNFDALVPGVMIVVLSPGLLGYCSRSARADAIRFVGEKVAGANLMFPSCRFTHRTQVVLRPNFFADDLNLVTYGWNRWRQTQGDYVEVEYPL